MVRRHWMYLKYILRHKWFVFQEGRKSKLPILFLILHDWSKFTPSEWFPYARCFYKPDGTKQYDETYAFNEAWNHHQKANKHHWQYWMLTWDRGETTCLIMPPKYLAEMVADWRGAGRAINGKDNTLEWYMKNRDNIKLHPNTRMNIENWLDVPKEQRHIEIVAWLDKLHSGETTEYWSSQGKPK